MSRLKQAEKVVLIRELEEHKRLDIGYLIRHLCRLHFPMTRPKGVLEYERRDGNRIMRVVSDPKYGLPYGQDTVVLYGLCTRGRELYKKHGKDWNGVVSFSSTAEMLRYSGYPAVPQYYNRYMQGLLRVWGTRLYIDDTLERKGSASRRQLSKADFLRAVTAWFQLEDRQIGMAFENTIEFTPEMVEWIRQAPAFEDQKIFLLKQAVGALQLYLLLRDRCAAADLRDKEYTMIPIHGPTSIESQLGWILLPAPKHVRMHIKRWLELIRTTVWPECPGEIWQGRDGYWRLKVWYVPPLFVR